MKLTTLGVMTVVTLSATLAANVANADHKRHSYKHHQDRISQHHNKGSQHHDRDQKHSKRYRYGEVLDVEPVYRYYHEPAREVSCRRYNDRVQPYTGYTSTIVGAVIGGALGHTIGDHHGDPEVAAIAGGLLGASLGRSIDRRVAYNRQFVVDGPCGVSGRDRERRQLVEYKVRYRYNGRTHYARMDHDPGNWVKLNVDITPA
jgi:uncharacterized protein YcfJ